MAAAADVCLRAWFTDLFSVACLRVNACVPRSLFLQYNVSSSPMPRQSIGSPLELDREGMIAGQRGPGIEIAEKAVERFWVA